MRTNRKFAALTVSGLIALSGLIAAPSAASAATCATGWGSLPESSSVHSQAHLTGVRAGSHPCYDRVVIDLAGRATGYDAHYVSAFYTDGEGRLVPARGGAKLQVVVRAPAYDNAGHSTYRPANPKELFPTAGKATLRQGVWLGSFEGQSTIGIGVRARLPFKVTTLSGPGTGSRLVIDIAHTW